MARKTKVKVKKSRKTRKGTLAGSDLGLKTQDFTRIAEIILESVREEIRKEIAKSSGLRGNGPVPIPDSRRFVDSFKYKINGKNIEIYSNWPTAAAHLNKKDSGPFQMKWLSKSSVDYARIQTKGGLSVVRSTPSSADLWVHPGFKKYNFLDRGVRKGQKKAYEEVILPKIRENIQKKGFL